MAKIRARGAHQVAAFNATRGEARYRFVLRSDGAILRRLNEKDLQSGYVRWGTSTITDPAILKAYLEARGYGVES